MRVSQAGRTCELVILEESPLRKADPRTKLFISIAISLVVMMPLEKLAIFLGGYALFLVWGRLLLPALRQVWLIKWVLIILFAVDWWLIDLNHALIICTRIILLTGVFASTQFGGFEEINIATQLWAQFQSCIVTIVYGGIVSFILLKVIDLTIGLRVDDLEETQGLDITLHNEEGYNL